MPSALDYALNPSRQLPSPWASLPATPTGYIAGQNGANVISDYQRGGKYSTYPDARTGVISDSYKLEPTGHYVGAGEVPNLQTLASGGDNHLTAWMKGNAQPQKIQGPFDGMPSNLATIAKTNLGNSDASINAFNEKAKMFSWGSAHQDQSATQPPARPAAQTVLQGSALDRPAYNQISNPNLIPAGAAKSAVGVEDQRRIAQESSAQDEEY